VTTKPLPEQRRRRTITPKQREQFLEALAAGWAVRHAARLSGVDFRRWYELRDTDEAFAQAWTDAVELGTQALEDEARRRAVDGWDEDYTDGDGKLIRRVRRYDGSLLQTLLKGRRPEVYRDYASPARLEVNAQVQIEGHKPTGIEDVIALAGELGVLERLGYQRIETIDGEAQEEPLALPREAA
jgi:hypothetical protein